MCVGKCFEFVVVMEVGTTHSFKNFRRGYLKENTDNNSPPSKHARLSIDDGDNLTDEEYDDAVKELQGR